MTATSDTQGHPASPGPYPAGTYAEGTANAAQESARLLMEGQHPRQKAPEDRRQTARKAGDLASAQLLRLILAELRLLNASLNPTAEYPRIP